MQLSKVLFAILLFPLGAIAATADEIPKVQDFEKTVLALSELKIHADRFEVAYGTGFCVDRSCQTVATNYHIGKMTNASKIKGRKIVSKYDATGPDDAGATLLHPAYGGPPMRFNGSHDLTLFKLDRPLPFHHGIGFRLEELRLGQEVEIYAYPLESKFEPRTLIRYRGRFCGITQQDLLTFDYEASGKHLIRPGASGGIVVDSKSQKIVGILSGIADDGTLTAFAVSVQTLAEFIAKVEPDLAQAVFDQPVPAVSLSFADLFPKLEARHTGTLERRSDEPPAVMLLRRKSQGLADSMQNFIARQSVEWGSGNKSAAAAATYEIRVLDGQLKFREYPDGRKELQELPFPPLNTSIVTGDEWSELPRMVAWNLRLRVEQMPDSVLDGRRIQVFRYRGDIEDSVCRWRSNIDFGFFEIHKDVTVTCYGEVWTDENTNILRMSEHYELPGSWKEYKAVMTYGWLRRPGEEPRLIPTTIESQAQFHNKTYWCRSQFLNYQVFTSEVRMTMK